VIRLPADETGSASHATPIDGMWSAFARSVRDNLAAEGAVQTLRVGGMIVLARALGPADFGLFRVLLVVSALALLSNQTGIPDALIQRRHVTPEHESTALWLSTAIALATSIALYLAAPLIAEAMAIPGLAASVRLLCIPIILEGTAVTAGACLRRQLKFTSLAIAEVVAEVAFLVTALVLLHCGEPFWSLPGGLAARLTVHAVTIWLAEPRFPLVMPTRRAARDFARFAGAVWSGQFIYVLSSNADYLLVGRLLGSSALGFYSIAWDLLRFVPDRLHRVAGRVTFPAFSQLQDDRAALARAYLDFFEYIARIAVPIAACAALAAPEILATIYGTKWLAAALPMRLLAPGLAMCGLRLGIGSVFYARNRPGLDLYLHGARLAAIIVTIFCLARWGLTGVSAGMSVLECAISLAGQSLACTLVGIGMGDLASAAMRALRPTLGCLLATFCGRSIAMMAGLQPGVVLIAAVLPAALVYAWMEGAKVMTTINKAIGVGGRARAGTAQIQSLSVQANQRDEDHIEGRERRAGVPRFASRLIGR
jgi:O-antigen/teichoic acid export membrane protein